MSTAGTVLTTGLQISVTHIFAGSVRCGLGWAVLAH